jgi:hypothetical protein
MITLETYNQKLRNYQYQKFTPNEDNYLFLLGNYSWLSSACYDLTMKAIKDHTELPEIPEEMEMPENLSEKQTDFFNKSVKKSNEIVHKIEEFHN